MGLTSVLSELVPPPSYIALPCVGVDISDTSMKYIAFKPTLGTRRAKVLEAWGDIEIPNNSLNRGEVTNPKLLAEALKEFKSRTGANFVRVSLPEERAYIFETEIKSSIPANEIQSLLEFRLEENVPIAARDAIFDYEIIPQKNETSLTKVVVAAYQRDTIMQYYEACLEAKLTPISFEVEAQAMARAVIPKAQSDHTIMLIDFGKTRTGVGIINKGVLLYTSTIDIGGGQLSATLRKVLGENTAESELTKIKNTAGLIRGLKDTQVYDSLISTISVIKDEIALRMQYWHTKTGSIDPDRRINQLVLCGGSANLKGLPEYLTESLGVNCVRGNVWENAFDTSLIVPPIAKNYSYGYATAIGLAIQNTV